MIIKERGTRDGTRTRTTVRSADFKSAAYTIPPPWQGEGPIVTGSLGGVFIYLVLVLVAVGVFLVGVVFSRRTGTTCA